MRKLEVGASVQRYEVANNNNSYMKQNPTVKRRDRREARSGGNRSRGAIANHLLAFSHREVKPLSPEPKPKRKKSVGGVSNREQYLQANFQFLLLPGADVSHECFYDPDALCDWDSVECVRLPCNVSGEGESNLGKETLDWRCPICLEQPRCPRITRCGHGPFCFSCILRHLDGERFKRCPMCFDNITRERVRVAAARNVPLLEVGKEVELHLLHREKLDLVPTCSLWPPPAVNKGGRNGGAALHECPVEGSAAESFSRLVLAQPWFTESRMRAEEAELLAFREASLVSGETEWLPFITEAKDLISLRRSALIEEGHLPPRGSSKLKAPPQVALSAAYPTSSLPVDGIRRVVNTSAKSNINDTNTEVPLESKEPEVLVVHNEAEEGVIESVGEASAVVSMAAMDEERDINRDCELGGDSVLSDVLLSDFEGPVTVSPLLGPLTNAAAGDIASDMSVLSISQDDINVEEVLEECKSEVKPIVVSNTRTKGNAPAVSSGYSFFQMKDGQLAFLHPLSMRCMLEEFSTLPLLLKANVLEVETVQLTRDMRRRYAFLSHLPEHCSIRFVELDLKSMLSEETLAKHGAEITKRHRRRRDVQKKAEREERDEAAKALEREQLHQAHKNFVLDTSSDPLPGREIIDECTVDNSCNSEINFDEDPPLPSRRPSEGSIKNVSENIAPQTSPSLSFATVLARGAGASISDVSDFPSLSLSRCSPVVPASQRRTPAVSSEERAVAGGGGAWGRPRSSALAMADDDMTSPAGDDSLDANLFKGKGKKSGRKGKGTLLFSNGGGAWGR